MPDRERPGSPFNALILDVGGVLVDHENHLIHDRLSARCGVSNARLRVVEAIGDPRWDNGLAPIAELHAGLQRELGYAGNWNTFLTDWTCHFTLNEPMVTLVQALAKHHRIILFSNTNAAHWDYLLARYPDVIDPFERYLSYEIGLSKPDTAAFDHVARGAGIAPARSLFFDDRQDNVEGARRAGFVAEVFHGASSFESTIARRTRTARPGPA